MLAELAVDVESRDGGAPLALDCKDVTILVAHTASWVALQNFDAYQNYLPSCTHHPAQLAELTFCNV